MTRSVFRCVIAVLIFGAAAIHAQKTLFMPAPGSPFHVGPGSGQLLLGDLDRDGRLDMVTRHLLELKLKVFRGDGKGGFTAFPGGEIRLSDQPGTVALADTNNDGILDLIATRNHTDAVDIFLGDGKGGFTAAPGSPFIASPSTAPYTHGVFLLDLNEDGKLDLVTSNGKSHELGILFGDGRGRFVAGLPVKLDPGRSQAFYAMGDVDEDGHTDLITMSGSPDDMRTGMLTIWRGDGKGGFARQPGSPMAVPPDPHMVMLAKLGNDGRPDIVSSHGGGYLSVLHNRGAGTFEPAPGSPYRINGDVYGMEIADVNGDRQSDLIAATVDSVTVLLGDGRSFVPIPQFFRAGPGAYRVAIGDLNNDGVPDVAASSFEGNAVTILLGQNSQRPARAAQTGPAIPRKAAGR